MANDDPLSVQEAAALLDLDERAVRLLASSGQISSVKRGRSWWLDRNSVERRRRQPRGPGQPLSQPVAWMVLLLASGAPGAEAFARHPRYLSRARAWLEAHPLEDHSVRLRARAKQESFDIHPAEISRVLRRGDVMRTGISAAETVGLHGGDDTAEIYAPAGLRDEIVNSHGLEPGQGQLLIRWVPDALWPVVGADVAPKAAVLVDLLEHDDPRARREAAQALRT